jgi:hypothetical protein
MNECYNIVVVVKVATAVRGGGRDPRTAIEGSFLAWGDLGKPNPGRDRGETDSGTDRDSDETFQISRNLGLEHVEFVCLLDSQLCVYRTESTNLGVVVLRPSFNSICRN